MSEPTFITIPHSRAEDVLGVLSGTFIASLGLYLLHEAHAVTGGVAGLALLITYAVPWSLSVVLIVANLPFFALALWLKGVTFTAKSLVSVGLLSAFVKLHEQLMGFADLSAPYAVITGNLLAGVGILILFRHGSSLGGFSVLALVAQERAGIRAGYVQLALDFCVIAAAILVVPIGNVLLSAVGAFVLNLVLAVNHRPGRYLA